MQKTQLSATLKNLSLKRRPVVLCVLDGWGHREEIADNAVLMAKAPNWHALLKQYPHALLEASELHVGLPQGQMGNSEVGHMNMGAGRVVMQDLPRIDMAVDDASITRNPALGTFIDRLRSSGGTCHLMGLLSPGCVHAHQRHLVALATIISQAGIPIMFHAFLDGRDTPPKSAEDFLQTFVQHTNTLKNFRLATLGGRYYAMDRDNRWDRINLAYECLVNASGQKADHWLTAIKIAYQRGESDEFVKPTVLSGYQGMKDGDGILMGNFRADRVRQILLALLDPSFNSFNRTRRISFSATLGMTEYSVDLSALMPCLFPSDPLHNTLGEVVSKAGLRQLRIAETEKYPHVTFFFNGGEEKLFPGEERILIPSPKVATYDLKPEMSAYEVTDKLVAALETGKFDFLVVNYANTDMVGHSGNLTAAIAAVEAVDRCLGRLKSVVEQLNGAMLITADHGNAEMMTDPSTGQNHTAHTLNPVPVILLHSQIGLKLHQGSLADVAPTILQLLGLPQPIEMRGRSLINA